MNKESFISRRFHIIIDAFDCDEALLSDRKYLLKFIKKVAQLLDMKILKGPVIAKGVAANPGLTLFAIIDFSHISIHTFTKPKELCLDIFSCKPFAYKKLERYVKRTFRLKEKQILKAVVKYYK